MKRIILIAALSLLAASAAGAASFPFGFQAGMTSDPDQFHVGAHAVVAEPFTGVNLKPGLELGFGDDITMLAINGDLIYEFTELETSEWGFYAGGGLNLYYMSWDNPYGDDSETELGLTAVGGVQRKLDSGDELFLELRLNVVDSPDFKLTAGITLF